VSTLTPRQAALAAALAAAKQAALRVQPGDDNGSANFDSPFLYATPSTRAATVRKAAEAVGVEVSRYNSRWWKGWAVDVTDGQGAMRTRMAEAAAQALRGAGEYASVYYQVD
jgi:hypothetical protein